jgi:hypothetical protein
MPEPQAHQTRVPMPDGTTRSRFSGPFGFVIAIIGTIALTAVVDTYGAFGSDGGQVSDDSQVRWAIVGPSGEVTEIGPFGL